MTREKEKDAKTHYNMTVLGLEFKLVLYLSVELNSAITML